MENCVHECNLEHPEALLKGLSKLAVVTAVHPGDVHYLNDTKFALPRQWQGDRRTNSTKDHWETGNGEYCRGTRRLGGKKGVSRTVDWAIGSVDLQIFDARSGTFTGPELHRMPLFLVDGAGNTAALTQAKLMAQAELCRLARGDREDDRLDDWFKPAVQRLAAIRDADELNSEVSSWPTTIGNEPCDDMLQDVLMLLEAARQEQTLQLKIQSLFIQQHGHNPLRSWTHQFELFPQLHENVLTGQIPFPDKLHERDVSDFQRLHQAIQDYDPEPDIFSHGLYCKLYFRYGRRTGVLRTDYLLW
jgi:hypothetical protein